VTKHRAGGCGYGRSGARGGNHYDDRKEGNQREDLPRVDAEPLPLPP
jgi:hypothetical protein